MRIWDKYVSGKAADWTAIFTGLLAIFTIVLVVYTAKLSCIASEANKISVATQRAFVNFLTIMPMKAMSPDGKRVEGINFFVNWTNSGTTPTRTAFSNVNIQPWRSGLPKGFDYADVKEVEKRAYVFGPKATLAQLVGITIEEAKDVREGKSHLYCWGSTVYKDFFPETPDRLTEFCEEITILSVKPDDITDASAALNLIIVPCEQHNCYDEDCRDYKSQIKQAEKRLQPASHE